MPFCTSCGQPVQTDDVFCSQCGSKQEHRAPTTVQAPPPSAVPTVEGDGKGPLTQQPQQAMPQRPAPQPQPQPQSQPQPQPRPVQQHDTTPRGAPPKARRRNPVKTRRGGLTFFGVLLALAWLAYSSGFMGALAGSYQMDINAFISRADWVSFGLMLGVPLAISRLRGVLDFVLLPLQPIRFLIPPRMLVGMGLIAPFAMAWWLYNVAGYDEYPFLHMCLIFGPLISYAILRTPERYSV